MNSMDTGSEESFSMKDAVQVLYPSRVKSPYLSSIGKNKQRFSELLLEHGEQHLQDWAVVASSSAMKSDDSTETKQPVSRRKTYRSSSSSQATRNNGKNGSSSRRDYIIRERHNMCPSTCMQSVEGRLRLCSRSIVFEPNDVSRGIIRCPLDRMEKAPFAASKNATTTQKDRPFGTIKNANDPILQIVVVVKSTRHFVMKTNNIIAPYKTESDPTEFQFSFLHSKPQKFFELSNASITFYDIMI